MEEGLQTPSAGKGHDFTSARQFCAWLGLVPGQYSSGGKPRLGRAYYQGGRPVFAHPADHGWQGGAGSGEGQDRFGEPLGAQCAGAPGLLVRGGGCCSEERSPVLGDAAAGRGVQDAGVVDGRLA